MISGYLAARAGSITKDSIASYPSIYPYEFETCRMKGDRDAEISFSDGDAAR